jgi:2-polyprenyl-3-methyl-5-hydroxy-6-metoxy-1,4-benzoquinol methylase
LRNINDQGGETLTNSAFNRHLEYVEIKSLLEKLQISNMATLLHAIEHFTQKEAKKRDKILLSYFGENGVNRIVKSICDHLLLPPKLKGKAQILDLGAGSGLFTVRIAQNLQKTFPKASFYAMDITPAMLRLLAKKTSNIIPFLGMAKTSLKASSLHENI